MKQLFTFLLVALSSIVMAQAPQSIPYQAIVRNTDGSVMASTSFTMTFKIHDVSATGTVVYEETHTTASNTQGLVSINVGAGTAVTGTFAGINWGSGAKFLHVLMNTGSGNVDLGTQQMMSVPYALYAEKANTTNVSVSAVGDTLYLGNGNYILVPGISNSNKTVNTGLGNQLLPGVTFCADKTISASGCGGLTTLDYQGYTYDLVEIAGQCWFKENLRSSSFNNGSSIIYAPDIDWVLYNSYHPYYAYYNNNISNQEKYGSLYNAVCLQSSNICPVGWHIPTLCDVDYLLYHQGAQISELGYVSGGSSLSIGVNALLAYKLFSSEPLLPAQNPDGTIKISPNNASGFSARAGGLKDVPSTDIYEGEGFSMWITTAQNPVTVGSLDIHGTYPGSVVIMAPWSVVQNQGQGTEVQIMVGRSIRCLKD